MIDQFYVNYFHHETKLTDGKKTETHKSKIRIFYDFQMT